jgi:pimeloyl-ACP methyl ester carboxylesterase
MAAAGPSASRARPVSFRTEDGWQLRGSFWEARVFGSPALLLLHDHSANRSVWEPYAGFYVSRGWSVLTFDLRGHGESVRHDTRAALLAGARDADLESGWALDVLGGLAFLAAQPRTDAKQRAVVGVGLGADLAYAAAARDWGASSTVSVSPDEVRARRLAGIGQFRPRGAALIYGALDPLGNAAALGLAACADYPAECHAYACTGATGMKLWDERQPEIVARTVAWIEHIG